ncbi:complement C5-like [Equus asinus]|uniref:complement C5-like n=1 Tax=Equus asinus TaxID=9793 RepID=UPI0038F6B5EB
MTGEQTAELVSDSVHLNIGEKCGNQVLRSFDKSDQDCGTGGGRSSAEVFYLAGLPVLTNANADDSQQDADGSFKKILRSRRDLKEEIENPEVSKVYTMSSNVRSIFLENWLWKVYHVPERHQLELMLPDFLTTWEIQGIGISSKVLNSETMAEAPAAILHYEVTLKIEARCQHGGTKR